jgi:amino acid transporter
MVLLGFFTLTVLLYAVKHGVGGFGLGDFAPSYAVFIALVPILFFNYVGFELPSTAGEEMTNPQRDVPFAVIRSAFGTILLHGLPILAILLVLPKNGVTNLSGFLDAIKVVFTVYGGHVAANGTSGTLSGCGKILGDVAAIGFILALLSSGTTWIMGADRAMAASGFDGAGPRSFGRLSARFGTPVTVNLWSGILSTVVMIAAYQISGGNTQKYFSAVLGLAISTTTISYLLIFPTFARLRKTHGHVERPYRVPGSDRVAWLVSALTTFWAALATFALLWPGFGVGWFGTAGRSNDALVGLGFKGQRLQFELSQFVPLAFFLGMGVVFYLMGKRTREQVVDIPFSEELAKDGHRG